MNRKAFVTNASKGIVFQPVHVKKSTTERKRTW